MKRSAVPAPQDLKTACYMERARNTYKPGSTAYRKALSEVVAQATLESDAIVHLAGDNA